MCVCVFKKEFRFLGHLTFWLLKFTKIPAQIKTVWRQVVSLSFLSMKGTVVCLFTYSTSASPSYPSLHVLMDDFKNVSPIAFQKTKQKMRSSAFLLNVSRYSPIRYERQTAAANCGKWKPFSGREEGLYINHSSCLLDGTRRSTPVSVRAFFRFSVRRILFYFLRLQSLIFDGLDHVPVTTVHDWYGTQKDNHYCPHSNFKKQNKQNKTQTILEFE